MSNGNEPSEFDVAIVGGGPAGLSAAVVLGRSCRRVVLFDHGRPRNYAAQAVHCYLGRDGIAPGALRDQGRNEAKSYGVELIDTEVVSACRSEAASNRLGGFEIRTSEGSFKARTLLLCTGVVDELPDIPGIRDFYGRWVHHCPYCDGWEHRGQRLVALGNSDAVVELAISLRTWSPHVIACSNGRKLSDEYRSTLSLNDVSLRMEKITGLQGTSGRLEQVLFDAGPPLPCDAVFFSAGQFQHSPLTTQLGCEADERGLIRTGKKQSTGVDGLFLAGDADGEVQFAIVAAAEGAVAAVAINHLLQEEDQKNDDSHAEAQRSRRNEKWTD
jgi:thioredoxin reductase